jgi:hypothetical protein
MDPSRPQRKSKAKLRNYAEMNDSGTGGASRAEVAAAMLSGTLLCFSAPGK